MIVRTECLKRESGEISHQQEIFRGKVLFHQSPRPGATPGDSADVLSSDLKIETSYDRDRDQEQRVDMHVVLDDIRSQWNVGSIFRTTDAAGWRSVTLTGISACPPATGVLKTALGAESWIPWTYSADISPALLKFQEAGCSLAALELCEGATSVYDFSPPRNVALVVGNEVSGVSPEALRLCQHRLFIPMAGRKGSLNVAVAFGVASFALARRWRDLHL